MTHASAFFAELRAIASQLSNVGVEDFCAELVKLRERQGRLFVVGAGGSTGNCSRAVNDFRKLFGIETCALTDGLPELTAHSNGEDWQTVFTAWLAVNRGSANDALMVLSLGGGDLRHNASASIVRGIHAAKARGMKVLGIVGWDGGCIKQSADVVVLIPAVEASHVTLHADTFQPVLWRCRASHSGRRLLATESWGRPSMTAEIIPSDSLEERARQPLAEELSRLQEPDALIKRLTEIDQIKAFRRILVMGCGRSGTWLLTQIMSTFLDADVVCKELACEYFGLLTTSCSVLVLKRDHLAYQRIEKIPECIEIAYIIRHPFDVLTSHLPKSRRPYHILPDRWLGEMGALRHLTDSDRKLTKVVRYEDLVSRPVDAQEELGSFFSLRIGVPAEQLYTVSNNSAESTAHRLRKIDSASIGKYRRDPEKIDYLRTIRPQLWQALEWVGQTYNYDLSL